MICPSCGINAPDDAKECPFCGEKLSGEDDSIRQEKISLWDDEPEEDEPGENAAKFPWETTEEGEVPENNSADESETAAEETKGLFDNDFDSKTDLFGNFEEGKDESEDEEAVDGWYEEQEEEPKEKPQRKKREPAQMPAFNLNPKILLIAGAAVIAVFVLVFAVSSMGKKKETVITYTEIALGPYVSVSFSGYDGYGTAEAEISYADFMTGLGSFFGDDAKDVCETLSACLVLSKEEGLSNGNTVTLSFDGDASEIENTYLCTFVLEEQEIAVSGLGEAETYDPFTHVTVAFSGLDGNGSPIITNTSSSALDAMFSYETSETEGLSNGDVITVTALYDANAVMEEFGYIIDPQEKSFTVSGLSGYLTSADDITEDVWTKLLSTAESAVKSYISEIEDNTLMVGEYTYIGNYFLTPRDITENSSEIYLVYRLDAEVYYEDKDGFTDEAVSFYYYAGFSGLTMLDDGTISLDYSKTLLPENTFEFMSYELTGYDDLDVLLNNVVTSRVPEYSYENNVEDVDTGGVATIDWTEIPDDAYYYAGHYYYVFEASGITWEQAKENAAARGGYLAVITTEDEKAAVQNLLSGYAWVGAYKVAGNTTFKWVNGEAYEYDTDDAVLASDEAYLALGLSGWNTYKYANGIYTSYNESMIDNSVNYYICEWED